MLLINIHILETHERKQLAFKRPLGLKHILDTHETKQFAIKCHSRLICMYGDLQWLALRACHCKSPYRSTARILSIT